MVHPALCTFPLHHRVGDLRGKKGRQKEGADHDNMLIIIFPCAFYVPSPGLNLLHPCITSYNPLSFPLNRQKHCFHSQKLVNCPEGNILSTLRTRRPALCEVLCVHGLMTPRENPGRLVFILPVFQVKTPRFGEVKVAQGHTARMREQTQT